MYRGATVAVVMPVHNEQAHIGRAITRVPDFVDHIIAVDDGSSDGTAEQLNRLQSDRLVTIRHQRNCGVGAATKTGYRRALSIGADFIAVMDGDGQMDGRDLHRLLDSAIRGSDFVKGNRFLDPKCFSTMPVARYAGNRLFSFLTGIASSFDQSLDAHCGYTVISRRALQLLCLDSLYDRYGFPLEMFFAVNRAGLIVECVKVRTIYGDEVSGINPLTAVPMVLYLIARSFLRNLIQPRSDSLQPLKAKRAEFHLEA